MAWLLHRAWVRTIHLRSLEIGSEKFGSDHLHQIMQLGIALHIAELVGGQAALLLFIILASKHIY